MGKRENPTSKLVLFPQDKYSQSVAKGPAPGAFLGNLSEMQIPRLPSRPTHLGGGQQALQVMLAHAQWEQLSSG